MSDGESMAGRNREVVFSANDPHALTREQVEQVFNAVYWHGDQQGIKQCEVLDGVDAQRLTIEQLHRDLVRERALRKEHGELIGNMQQTMNQQAQEIEQYKAAILLSDERMARFEHHLASMTAERDEARLRRQETMAMSAQLADELHSLKKYLTASEQEAGRLKIALNGILHMDDYEMRKAHVERALKGDI